MENLNIPFTVICSLSSALLAWYGAYNTMKKRTGDDARRWATLETQVSSICASVSEIKASINASVDDRRKISEVVESVRTEVSALSKRVDKLEERR